ncbi:hypothetical protein JCM25156A_11800 [Komagataeibacter kakiaceti JCM 25156]
MGAGAVGIGFLQHLRIAHLARAVMGAGGQHSGQAKRDPVQEGATGSGGADPGPVIAARVSYYPCLRCRHMLS